jgi:hypothetical protein
MILKEEGKVFDLVPAGQYLGVCVDFVDIGMVETSWRGEKRMTHKCRIVFELAETNPKTGDRYIAGERFTASLSEKANLRAFLEQWRGQPFTADELKGFDTEKLIGANAYVQIVHNAKDDKTYDNINSVMKPMKGTARLEPSGKYQRVKDRPKPSGNGTGPLTGEEPPHPAEVAEEDLSTVPF